MQHISQFPLFVIREGHVTSISDSHFLRLCTLKIFVWYNLQLDTSESRS